MREIIYLTKQVYLTQQNPHISFRLNLFYLCRFVKKIAILLLHTKKTDIYSILLLKNYKTFYHK